MAAITTKRSPGFFSSYSIFAIVVSTFVYAEMVSAWKNICVPGDIYMDLTITTIQPECSTCTTWCESECSKLELSLVKDTDKCSVKSSTLRCKCCCETPSSPEKPPLPPSASEFVGTEPYNYEICESNQTSEKFQHPDGKDCIHKPLCEKSCNEKGLPKARSECVAAAHNSFTKLIWYEQCCCENLAPPPPPPTPPTDVCEDCSYLKRIGCVLPFSSCNCCCKSLHLLSCKGIPPTQ
ncbi:hypothetical protein MKW98_014525 [Papaver atlanticum]|uniref:Uncharacterized protein n=1 Tax=Papaver atlanticum TaxID=357466 RepID=A0AAD4SKH2_9MAGN|nr:hypothetical protein MKW98_014525 [Papaver atlanticum]